MVQIHKAIAGIHVTRMISCVGLCTASNIGSKAILPIFAMLYSPVISKDIFKVPSMDWDVAIASVPSHTRDQQQFLPINSFIISVLHSIERDYLFVSVEILKVRCRNMQYGI